MNQQTVHSPFAGIAKWTDGMVISHGGQLPMKDIANLEDFWIHLHSLYTHLFQLQ